MAVIKHIAIKNARYIDVVNYLEYQHNELTNKPIRDENGRLIEREGYVIGGVNCTPESFPRACEELNEKYEKNNSKEEIKAHHYILSFDPRDREDNGLTVERAQQLGIEFCNNHFPGHQAIVCTHPDGHNGAGNIHVHIVINSIRMEDVERKPYMDRASDSLAGFKPYHLAGVFAPMACYQFIGSVLQRPYNSRHKNADALYALCDHLHLLIIPHLERMILEWDKLF